jgi:hypothetical protein
MEHEGSLPSLQELSTCTYPEPNQSSPQYSTTSYGCFEVQVAVLHVVALKTGQPSSLRRFPDVLLHNAESEMTNVTSG